MIKKELNWQNWYDRDLHVKSFNTAGKLPRLYVRILDTLWWYSQKWQSIFYCCQVIDPPRCKIQARSIAEVSVSSSRQPGPSLATPISSRPGRCSSQSLMHCSAAVWPSLLQPAKTWRKVSNIAFWRLFKIAPFRGKILKIDANMHRYIQEFFWKNVKLSLRGSAIHHVLTQTQ